MRYEERSGRKKKRQRAALLLPHVASFLRMEVEAFGLITAALAQNDFGPCGGMRIKVCRLQAANESHGKEDKTEEEIKECGEGGGGQNRRRDKGVWGGWRRSPAGCRFKNPVASYTSPRAVIHALEALLCRATWKESDA